MRRKSSGTVSSLSVIWLQLAICLVNLGGCCWTPHGCCTLAALCSFDSSLVCGHQFGAVEPIKATNCQLESSLVCVLESQQPRCEVLSIARCHGSLEGLRAAQGALPSRIQVEAELKGLSPGQMPSNPVHKENRLISFGMASSPRGFYHLILFRASVKEPLSPATKNEDSHDLTSAPKSMQCC